MHATCRGLLAQEQGERARLLGGMRDALAGLKATGDTEGKLRGELLQAHQVSWLQLLSCGLLSCELAGLGPQTGHA
jgi:hypothetical protein